MDLNFHYNCVDAMVKQWVVLLAHSYRNPGTDYFLCRVLHAHCGFLQGPVVSPDLSKHASGLTTVGGLEWVCEYLCMHVSL